MTPANSTVRCRVRSTLADWTGFDARAAAARQRGALRGFGIATYIEACGGNGPDTATISLEKDGTVRLHVGTQTTGQGHDTSFSQIIADHLHVPPEQRAHAAGRHPADRDRNRNRRIEFHSGWRQFGRDGCGQSSRSN